MAHRTWGSVPHFALCNSLFWQQAAHSHRGDRSPLGAPPGCTAASRLFARLVVETVRRPVRIRVERTHNRFAACIQPRHQGCFTAGITSKEPRYARISCTDVERYPCSKREAANENLVVVSGEIFNSCP